MDKNSENLRYFLPLFVLVEIVGILSVLITLYWTLSYRSGFAWTSNPGIEFNWHPFLMVIGMIYLQGNAILTFRAFRDNSKDKLKTTHAVLHGVVLLLSIIALIAVLDSHNLNNPPTANFYSLHSWIGVVALGGYFLQWLFGFVTYLYPRLPLSCRTNFMSYHVFLGHATFICGIAAALIGLNEKAFFVIPSTYSQFVAEGLLINFLGLLLIAFGGIVVYLSSNPFYKRYPRPEDASLITRDS